MLDQKKEKNKHLVLIASLNTEQGGNTCSCAFLAVHHGIDCTVLFGVGQNGEIQAEFQISQA